MVREDAEEPDYFLDDGRDDSGLDGDVPLDEEPLARILSGKNGKGNPLSDRPQQQELLRLIVKGFNEGRMCVAEGGPGVGKSLAYLLPACQWVDQNGGKVVIATSTINLQQQLVQKDIPLACRLLGVSVRTEVVKGWSNYLCLHRLSQVDPGGDLFDQSRGEQIRLLRGWAGQEHDGSRSSLNRAVSAQLWREVCAESDNCHRQLCRFHSDCFVLRARRAAYQAQILVANHHVLLSDLGLRYEQGLTSEDTALLPSFQRLVIDEAHNLERNASSLFSGTFGRSLIQASLSRFFHQTRGLWPRVLLHWPEDLEIPPLPQSVQSLEQVVLDLDGVGQELLGESRCYYIGYGRSDERADRLLLPIVKGLVLQLSVLGDQLARVADELRKMCETDEELELLRGEWLRLSRRFDAIRHAAENFCDYSQGRAYGCWLESVPGSCRFWVAPVQLGGMLKDLLYRQIESITFLSATLTVGQRFDYWLNRVGLAEEDVLTDIFPSPFDFQSNARLLIAGDAPSPQLPEFSSFLSNCLAEGLAISGGRALLLFTSYRALNQAHRDLSRLLPDYEFLCQGEGGSGPLLNRFRDRERSVLLATDSFWEGVDVAGPSLSLVVICRLPFRPPDDPWLKLRCQAIGDEGGNSFTEYQLPEAIMRFRQGCGRLLRSPEDRGVVLVLDGRLRSKPYGRAFLASLPPLPQERLPAKSISPRLSQLKGEGFLGGDSEVNDSEKE